jgi:hypothetical protein
MNDVTAVDLQNRDREFTRSKSFDTFAPLGPAIETAIENPDDLALMTRHNGKLRQNARTSDLIFKSDFLVSFISQIMTLLPGDVISTGTPPGMGQIKPGDVIEVEIERIGVLTNTVTALEEVDGGERTALSLDEALNEKRPEPFEPRPSSHIVTRLLLNLRLPCRCRRPIAFTETLAAAASPPLDKTRSQIVALAIAANQFLRLRLAAHLLSERPCALSPFSSRFLRSRCRGVSDQLVPAYFSAVSRFAFALNLLEP